MTVTEDEDPPRESKAEVGASRWTTVPRGTLSAQAPSLEPIDPADQAMFTGYVRSKAAKLVDVGIERFRRSDALGMPPESWPEDILAAVLDGSRQLTEGRGLSREHPFEGLSVQGCYALMRTLHFEVTGRQTERVSGAFLDEIRCEHKVAAVTRGSLFNQVARSG